MPYEVEYLGGHPEWGKPQNATLTINKNRCFVDLDPRGFMAIGKGIRIHKENILNVSFENIGSRSAGKTVAGALVGGALTGGIGFLVGGAIGANKKNLSEIFLVVKYKERELTIILKTGKNTEKIYSEINSLFI